MRAIFRPLLYLAVPSLSRAITELYAAGPMAVTMLADTLEVRFSIHHTRLRWCDLLWEHHDSWRTRPDLIKLNLIRRAEDYSGHGDRLWQVLCSATVVPRWLYSWDDNRFTYCGNTQEHACQDELHLTTKSEFMAFNSGVGD
ncbi:hypothetical protein R3P38DRAFT_1638399 [Favolaschia claudopus]|uniref:Uncharacterized protein n=1 Tax=Favolaschia claudopus TaxID=2862362 RepID=A0AAW0DIJ0_9AGAR